MRKKEEKKKNGDKKSENEWQAVFDRNFFKESFLTFLKVFFYLQSKIINFLFDLAKNDSIAFGGFKTVLYQRLNEH